MEREVRYCTSSDGVNIAFCMEGDGPPLFWCPIFVESFAQTDDNPSYSALMKELTERWLVIRYDQRGVGLSQRDVTDFTNETMVRDMEAIVEAAGLERFALWGSVLTGPRAITFAARHPEMVTHLILYDTFCEPYRALSIDVAKGLAGLARTNWSVAIEAISGMGRGAFESDPEMRRVFGEITFALARLYERSTDGHIAAEYLLAPYESWDVSGVLSEVRCPTLVVHHLSNQIFPFEAGKRIAAGIPGSRLVPQEGIWSTPMNDLVLGNRVFRAIEAFLPCKEEEPPAEAPAASSFRAVLFTDLVGHTEMMSRLGDERGRAVLREHEKITRDLLKQYGGTEVKAMGDGFMASFGSVAKAVECAIALQRAIVERNQQTSDPADHLRVRVGLNAGEPIEDEGDLFGATVILASRIAAKAEGGEILVADTVRGLCAGKGFMFTDHGEFVAKGFEEAVRLYEVRWRID
jgi:class 3 adenylate cyclase/pimeloyl-ACP methyl ester carboxylesterase